MVFSLLMEILVFTFALSIDSFGASFAYGASKIKIPLTSVFTISGICSGILFVSLLAGQGFLSLIPLSVSNNISFFLLFSIGLIKFFDSHIRHLINEGHIKKHKIHFHFLSLSFIITIYGDPEKANADKGQDLSPEEAISLAIALSLDSAAAGLGASNLISHPFLTVFSSFFLGMLAVILGSSFGNKLTTKTTLDFSWIGGFLLICLAIVERFF